jgi:hypothetical protein
LSSHLSSVADEPAQGSEIAIEQTRPAPTGDIVSDLEAMVRQIWHGLTERVGMGLIGTILVEERERPELADSFRKAVVNPCAEAVADLLRDGSTPRPGTPEADLAVAAELLAGAVFARYLTGRAPGKRWHRTVAEPVAAPSATRRATLQPADSPPSTALNPDASQGMPVALPREAALPRSRTPARLPRDKLACYLPKVDQVWMPGGAPCYPRRTRLLLTSDTRRADIVPDLGGVLRPSSERIQLGPSRVLEYFGGRRRQRPSSPDATASAC